MTIALLTPPGRGAIATLAVTGADAGALVARLFEPASGGSFAAAPPGRVAYGRWLSTGEDVIACRVAHDRVEIHCHGGRVAPGEILRSLVALGAREQSWQSWVEVREADPIGVAAQVALAGAGAGRAALVLADQYHGALRREIAAILDSLEHADAPAAGRALETLCRRAKLGARLTEPWTVLLAGRPNVGKSSLLNRILGYERAIVCDEPGTTRDVLRGATALDGWPFEFWDAAGLRDAVDPLEAAGVARTRERAAEVDLVALVFAAGEPWTAEDDALCVAFPEAIRIVNKSDLATPRDVQERLARASSSASASAGIGFAAPQPESSTDAIAASALTGAGFDVLCRTIVSRLIGEAPPNGAAVPFTAAQRTGLEQAARHVAAGELAAAGETLRDGEPWKLR